MISRKHRTIFVHIPKCAGQSVEMAFLADNGLGWETRAPLLLCPNADPKAGPPRLAHLSAAEYVSCGHVTTAEFESFYTFSIVRNPFARVVSLYRHLEPNVSFADFTERWLPEQLAEGAAQRWFVRPQIDFVVVGGKIAVKDIVRFENLVADFTRVVKRSGLAAPLHHANRSGARTAPDVRSTMTMLGRAKHAIRHALITKHFETRAHWRDYYGPAEIAVVAKLYADDFEMFGYVFDSDGPVR